MARKTYPPHPVRDRFLAQLRAFYLGCGSPPYPAVVEMWHRLPDIYGDRYGRKALRPLSVSALSETLNGFRKGLPYPGWVAGFVLACQRLAFEAGSIPVDPGADSLGHWQQLLTQAESDCVELGLPITRGSHATRTATRIRLGGHSADPAVMFAPAPPPQCADDSPAPAPVLLTDAQKLRVAGYGPYGQALLARVLTRDPGAIHQVALILAGDPVHVREAVLLLTDAAASGHRRALAILETGAGQLDRRVAADQARDLAHLAKRTGYTEAATAFFECAMTLALGDSPAGRAPGSGEAGRGSTRETHRRGLIR